MLSNSNMKQVGELSRAAPLRMGKREKENGIEKANEKENVNEDKIEIEFEIENEN